MVCFLPSPPTLTDIIATHRDFWLRKRGWTHVKAKNPTQTSGSVPSKTRSNQFWNDITSNEGCITGGQWRASLASGQWGGGGRAGPAECWVFVMQTRPFPTSIKEVASVESVQLGLCDTVGLSNLPVIVRELAIHFGVSHGVLRAFGALLSKARTRWHPPPPFPVDALLCFRVY